MAAMVNSNDIREARKTLNESQAVFGIRLGVDQSTIARWERSGIPNRGTARTAIERILSELERAD